MNVRLTILAFSALCLGSCASSHKTAETASTDGGYYTPTRYDDASSGGYVSTDGSDSRVQSSSSTVSSYDAYAYEDASANYFAGSPWGFEFGSPFFNPYSFYSPFGPYSSFGFGFGLGYGYPVGYNQAYFAYGPRPLYYGKGYYYPYYPGYGYYGVGSISHGLAYAPPHVNLLPYSNRVYSGTTVNSISRPGVIGRPLTSNSLAANTTMAPVTHNGFNTNSRSARVINRSNNAIQFTDNNRINNYTQRTNNYSNTNNNSNQRTNNVQSTRTFTPASSSFGGGGFSRGGSMGGGGRRF